MDLRYVENSKVQELYERCSMIFRGYDAHVPRIDEIRWLQDHLGTMEAVDVGINGSDWEEGTDDKDLISGCKLENLTYIHIHECRQFSIGVFCFPAGARLPLHDHPEMVVLSKVLYGSVLARSYDWVKPPHPKHRNCGLARVVMDDVALDKTSQPSVLFPNSGGNIHSFTAVTPCAILDVLSPPYSEVQSRPATYFSEIRIPLIDCFAILKERPLPDDLFVAGAPYLGPELAVEDLEEDDDDKEDDDDDDEEEKEDDDDDDKEDDDDDDEEEKEDDDDDNNNDR